MDSDLILIFSAFCSLFLSSIAGYGGSLILVPVLSAAMGPKEGIAFAALLLSWNNVFKAIAYKRTLSLREGWPLLLVTALGAVIGARLLVSAPEQAVYWAIVVVTAGSFAVEVLGGQRLQAAQRTAAVPYMALSAVLSGFSGTSGPLKGIAVRSLRLPRLNHVGLAASVSLIGDSAKLGVFAGGGLLGDIRWPLFAATLLIMPAAAWTGRAVNLRIDERGFQWVFWIVVGGYTLRMMGAWL